MKALAALAVVAMLAVALVPVSETDASVYNNISGDSVVATGDEVEYDITYNNTDYKDYSEMSMSITYEAALTDSSGETVSDAVDDSTGDMDNGETVTLTVTIPDTAGTYTLTVEYEIELSYTVDEDEDEEGGEVEEEFTAERSFTIKAVDPVTLSVTVTNNTELDLSGIGVYFYVDGVKLDDSYTTFSVEGEGETTVSYEWVAEVDEGEHTFYILATNMTITDITGLGEEYTFYVGDNDYTLWTALVIIIVIILLICIAWVYRKPVKNYGKPKARR